MTTAKAFWAAEEKAAKENWSGSRYARHLGIPVVPSTEVLTLEVSGNDYGEARGFASCANANAVLRQCTGALGAWVSSSHVYIFYADRAVKYNSSQSVKRVIASNDTRSMTGDAPLLGNIILRPVSPSQTKEGQREYKRMRDLADAKLMDNIPVYERAAVRYGLRKRPYNRGANTSQLGIRTLTP